MFTLGIRTYDKTWINNKKIVANVERLAVECLHFSNLQPLCAKKNAIKKDKIDENFLDSHIFKDLKYGWVLK